MLSIFLLLLFCGSIGKGWHLAKGGFNVHRIHGWSLPEKYPLSQEAIQILDNQQPFRFLGRGRQCYAFTSKDGKYVLKIPRTDRYHPPFWTVFFPKTRKSLTKDVDFRERFILESFRISFEELQDQTAVLALRMGSGDSLNQTIKIVDKLGRSYDLNLGKIPFLLQKKLPLLTHCFESAILNGKKQEAAFILDCFVDVVCQRAKKGILNKDPSFIKNFGFDGKRAYQIDVGSFYRIEKLGALIAIRKAMKDTLGPVRIWLAAKDQELADHLDDKIEEILQNS